MSFLDKRKIKRIELEIPAFLRFKKEKGKPAIELRTKNVSSHGVFLYSNMPLPIGTGVNAELILPNRACVKVDGTIIHSNQSGMGVCFSANFQLNPAKALAL